MRWGRIAREVTRPGLMLAVYCFVLMVFLPEGFNRRFVMFLALAACAVVAVALVVSAVCARVRPDGAGTATWAEERPHGGDLWLLLLPLAPVVQYMVVNRDTLSALGSVVGTTILAAFAVLIALVMPYLARRAVSRSVMMMAGIALAFVMFRHPRRTWALPELGRLPG